MAMEEVSEQQRMRDELEDYGRASRRPSKGVLRPIVAADPREVGCVLPKPPALQTRSMDSAYGG